MSLNLWQRKCFPNLWSFYFMSFIVTVWTLSPWIIFKYCVSYLLASRKKKSLRKPTHEELFIVQMSLYFTNINRSTDQISLKFYVCCRKSDYFEYIFACIQRTTQPSFKRVFRIRGQVPYQALITLCNWQVFQNKSNNFFTSNFSILQIFSPFSCIFFVSLQAGSHKAAFFLA